MRRSFAIALAALLSAAAVPALARPVPAPDRGATVEVQAVDWRHRGPPPGYYHDRRGPPPWAAGPRYSGGHYGPPPRHWAPPPRRWGPPPGYYHHGGYRGGPPRYWR